MYRVVICLQLVNVSESDYWRRRNNFRQHKEQA